MVSLKRYGSISFCLGLATIALLVGRSCQRVVQPKYWVKFSFAMNILTIKPMNHKNLHGRFVLSNNHLMRFLFRPNLVAKFISALFGPNRPGRPVCPGVYLQAGMSWLESSVTKHSDFLCRMAQIQANFALLCIYYWAISFWILHEHWGHSKSFQAFFSEMAQFDCYCIVSLRRTHGDNPETTEIAAVLVDGALGLHPDHFSLKVRPTENPGYDQGRRTVKCNPI